MASLSRAKCPYEGCEKTFFNKYNAKRHYDRKHLDICPYVCTLCANVLSSKQTLREHMNLHTGEKPYECAFPGCLKRFKQASTLSAHKNTHRRASVTEAETHVEPLSSQILQQSNREQLFSHLTLPKITGPQAAVLPSVFSLTNS